MFDAMEREGERERKTEHKKGEKRNFLFNNAPRSWLCGNEREKQPIYIDLT